MLNKLKYRLLVLLLDDICNHTICDDCSFKVGKMQCFMNETLFQARKTWRIE